MSKVSATTIKANHVKAARALVGWSAEEFAELLPIGVATLRTFESGKDIKPASKAAIFDTLHKHGIRMYDGGAPGVRITEPKKWAFNRKPTFCPECKEPLPVFRKPDNLRQSLWGGWTCNGCGTEVGKSGALLFKAR